ncbi:MAG: Fe-S cluster assembly protein SufD [Legionellales bacterium]|nr:Fe-S cluster assembly protein SufD [Legionellales bacterium]
MNMTEHWLQQFQSLDKKNNPHSALDELRHGAFLRWEKAGFPSTRHERWKYTELMGLAETPFQLPTPSAVLSNTVLQTLLPAVIENSLRAVFVDGEFSTALSSKISNNHLHFGSLHDGFKMFPQEFESYLESIKTPIDSIDDLNTSFSRNGALIFVPPHVKLPQTIHLIYLYTRTPNQMAHMHNRVHLAEGAEATIIEHHIGHDDNIYFSTTVNHISLEQQAYLNYYRCQEQGINAYHINRLYLTQARASVTNLFCLDFKGHLVRNEIEQRFIGQDAECHLHGFYLGKGRQHVDNYITVDHQVPHCLSSQRFKSVLDDRSHSVFHGKVKVAKDAQKTDATQHNANLILSTQAQINTEPQLEIFADDVKCAHGAAIGQLDESALFYLQSRGLDKETAKQMLIYSFAAEIFLAISELEIRAFWQAHLNLYFSGIPLHEELITC